MRELGRDAWPPLVPGGNRAAPWRGCCPSSASRARDGPEARARLFEQVLGLLERLARGAARGA
ncbi:hypothetical protein GCM10020220_018240 [Nonomuraea rubra]|uniref:hypothetical protein n=1 Tax=Nonomuraea rubra TaxID=46180 RepID=UPI0031F1A925